MNIQIDTTQLPKPKYSVGQEVWWIKDRDGSYGKSRIISRTKVHSAELKVEFFASETTFRMYYYIHDDDRLKVALEHELSADPDEIYRILTDNTAFEDGETP